MAGQDRFPNTVYSAVIHKHGGSSSQRTSLGLFRKAILQTNITLRQAKTAFPRECGTVPSEWFQSLRQICIQALCGEYLPVRIAIPRYTRGMCFDVEVFPVNKNEAIKRKER
ncbi:hypothetical protein STEG23_038427 [Scotinomys teguina]